MELTGEELKKINPCGKVPGWSIPFILLLLPPFSLTELKNSHARSQHRHNTMGVWCHCLISHRAVRHGEEAHS